MKTAFTSLFIFMLTTATSAQITIEREDYIRELGGSMIRILAENPEDIITPEAGQNMVWDYTSIDFPRATNSVAYAPLIPESFPEVPEANTAFYSPQTNSAFPGLEFSMTYYWILDEIGLREIAESRDGADYPIGAITGTATDVLTFADVLNIYEEPKIIFEFPIVYGDSIVRNFSLPADVSITATPFGLDNAPGQLNYLQRQEINVNGWGTLRLTNPLDGEPMEFEVLLVEQILIETDSIFLAGNPAPPALINAFGATQGEVTVIEHDYQFWAKGGLKGPLFWIKQRNNDPTSAELDFLATDLLSSTNKIAKELVPVKVSPNPSNGHFQINFTKEDAREWTFEVYNFIGQQLHVQPISGGRGTINETVTLDTPPPGTHVFVIRNSEGIIMSSGELAVH